MVHFVSLSGIFITRNEAQLKSKSEEIESLRKELETLKKYGQGSSTDFLKCIHVPCTELITNTNLYFLHN